MREALRADPEYDVAYGSLALLLGKQGRLADAAEVYRAWYTSDPENYLAKHMLAATSSVDVPARAAPEYVRHMFDLLASDFDRHLSELGYRGPALVADRLRARHAADFRPDILDAGCGTGLAGPLLRPFANRIVGVDLSPGMIEKARARGTYDELVVHDISEFMRSRSNAFDAVICVDTFIYFGAIDEPLRTARACLRTDGLIAFTTECLDDVAPYRLEAHGRYSHSQSYILQTASQAGFAVISVETVALRCEDGKDVLGYLVLGQALPCAQSVSLRA